ncbi:MAG: hypothetical protein JXA20_17945 [Spirochaetes bacterium]|nr:hypothetical protein [Spirochaetota bacterium]
MARKSNQYQIEQFFKYSQRLRVEYGTLGEIEERFSRIQKDYRLHYIDRALSAYEIVKGGLRQTLWDLSQDKTQSKLKKELRDYTDRETKLIELYNQCEMQTQPGVLTIAHMYNAPDPTRTLYSELGISPEKYDEFFDLLDELEDDGVFRYENNTKIGGRLIIVNARSPRIEIYKVYDMIKKDFQINVSNHWEILSEWFPYFKDGKLVNVSPTVLRSHYTEYCNVQRNYEK